MIKNFFSYQIFSFQFIIVLFLAAVSIHASTDPINVFSQAESQYKEARYNNAIVLYDSLLNLGFEDSRLFYNIGNAYFKTGHMAKAKLYYEKALVFAPEDQDVIHNIDVVDVRLLDRVEPVPQLFVVRWWNGIKNYHSAQTLFVWSLIFFVLLCAMVVVYYWWNNLWLRRTAFFSGILFIILFSLNIFLLLDKVEDYSAHRSAIVMDNSVTTRSTPDKSGVEAFTIHEGLKVEIVDQLDHWVKIRLVDGKIGWLPSQSVERI